MHVLWFLCVCWCASAIADRPAPYVLDDITEYFNAFMIQYNKSYADDAEKTRRMAIFRDNLMRINRLNEDPDDAVYGVTKFSDLSAEEFKETHKCLGTPGGGTDAYAQCTVLTDKDISAKDAPAAYDWRSQGAVSSVKDQGNCRSCWAFTATGHLEARNHMKHKKLVELSPQQLVDCDKLSSGCNGGDMESAFRSLIKLKGSMKEVDYPYVGRTETCKSDEKKVVVKVTRCSVYNLKSQEKVKQQLHKIGPICIGIKSTGLDSYIKGIVKDSTCSVGGVDHAVLIVGYGTENGKDYWLVKNSYGANWGESGYFRMERGETKTSCGMMNTYMSTADIE